MLHNLLHLIRKHHSLSAAQTKWASPFRWLNRWLNGARLGQAGVRIRWNQQAIVRKEPTHYHDNATPNGESSPPNKRWYGRSLRLVAEPWYWSIKCGALVARAKVSQIHVCLKWRRNRKGKGDYCGFGFRMLQDVALSLFCHRRLGPQRPQATAYSLNFTTPRIMVLFWCRVTCRLCP